MYPATHQPQALLGIMALIRPFRGRGMRITIFPSRGHEFCHCGARFTPDGHYNCEEHGTYPRKVYIDCSITGGERFYIRKDVDGDPLSLDKARRLLERMEADAYHARTEKEAKRLILRKYSPRDKKRHGFESVRDAYLDDCKRRVERGELTRGRFMNLRSQLARNFSYFDGMDVAEITSGVIQDYYDALDLSDVMRQVCVNVLIQMLHWAQARELIQIAPQKPKTKVLERADKTWLRRDQQEEILSHVPDEHRPILEFLAGFGWRPAEARALKVRDVKFAEGVIIQRGSFDAGVYKPFVKRKEKTGAAYPLEPVKESIQKALAGRVYGPDDFVFSPDGSGRHYNSYRLTAVYNAAAEAAGYGHVALNEFGRHSMASQIINGGGSVQDAADQLNNTSGVVRATYGKISAAKRGRVIRLIQAGEGESDKSVASGSNGTNSKNKQ